MGERLHATDTLLREMLARVVEALNETVADAVGGALEAVELSEVQPRAAQRVPATCCYKTTLHRLLKEGRAGRTRCAARCQSAASSCRCRGTAASSSTRDGGAFLLLLL